MFKNEAIRKTQTEEGNRRFFIFFVVHCNIISKSSKNRCAREEDGRRRLGVRRVANVARSVIVTITDDR